MDKFLIRNRAFPRAAYIACVPVFLVEICLAVRFAASHAPSQIFVYLTFCFASLVTFSVMCGMVCVGKMTAKKATIIVLAAVTIGVILELLTLFGSTARRAFHAYDFSKKRFALFTFAAFVSLCLAEYGNCGVAMGPRRVINYVRGHKAILFFSVIVLLVTTIVTVRIGTNVPHVFYAFSCCCIVAGIALFVRSKIRFEAAFFLVAFLSGALLIYGSPVTTGLSWDDQIHYENAVNASYLIESQLTQTDKVFAAEAVIRAQGQEAPDINSYDVNNIAAHAADLDASYESDLANGNVAVDNGTEAIFSMSSVGYTAFAIGLWLGRLMRLSFSSMVILSKMVNLIVYCAVVAFAISKTPSKKTVFAVVGLLPTSIFLASNFGYDSWLISFVMLGFAYYLRYAWGREGDFSKKNVLLAYFFMYVGLAVKAVYFPVIGIFLLVSPERLSATSKRVRYYASVIVLGMLVFASFVVPYLFTVASDAGDVRGGAGVDPGGQIAFILSDPLGYAKILFVYFCTNYLNPIHSVSFSLNFAYVGSLSTLLNSNVAFSLLGCIPAFALIGIGIISNDEISALRVSIFGSFWALFLVLSTLVLVATAMYVSFTPVGLGTVNGCQFRYILPLLVPGLCIVLNNRHFSFGANKASFAAALITSVMFFALCFACLVVPKYV